MITAFGAAVWLASIVLYVVVVLYAAYLHKKGD